MGACKHLIQMNLTSQAQPASSATKSKRLALVSVDPATEAAGMIDGGVDVNIAAVKALISESQSILASASKSYAFREVQSFPCEPKSSLEHTRSIHTFVRE